jgi:hypothetical protein
VAIPIRLTLANAKDQIDLVAQSIDMSINRNVSAFPTPNNFLQRFAVDTNVPSIKIDINGIFVDDEGLNVDAGNSVIFDAEPMRTMINFGALLPTKPNQNTGFRSLGVPSNSFGEGTTLIEHQFVANEDIPKGQKSTIRLLAPSGSIYQTASADTEQINVNPFSMFKSSAAYSSGVTSIVLTHTYNTAVKAEDILNVGDKLVKEDGTTTIGTIQSISNNTVTFTFATSTTLALDERIHVALRAYNHAGEELGFVSYLIDDPVIDDGDDAVFTLGLTDTNNGIVSLGQPIFINQAPNILERFRQQSIKFIPSYWLENPPVRGLLADSSMERAPSPHGPRNSTTDNGNVPRVGIRLEFDLSNPYTDSPTLSRKAFEGPININRDAADMDALINVPIQDIDTADNPALAMAEQIQKALDGTVISGDIVEANYPGFNLAGDKTLESVFSITRNGVLFLIEQKYRPEIEILHPSCLSPDLTDLFIVDLQFHSPGTTPTQSRKSAGDKVQDLIGLVSNSNRNTDLLRGIQIPYDSLVQSSGVTGVARNFFLTFGEIETNLKGSEGNNRSANKPMQNLLLGMSDGGAGDESPDNWYDKFIEPVIPNEIEAVFGFLVGAGQQMWVTLTDQPARGNDGGMRIIPEKLHVRYDAGNNYYAFNLELMASDYVIGV